MTSKDVSKVDLDTILIEDIGQFGRYQIINLLLAAIPVMFSAFALGEYIFTTGRLPTRCLIPECDVANPEFEPAWLGNAVPGSPGNYDECSRFVNVSAAVPPAAAADTCPAELFNRNQTISCDEYVYQRTNTVVYDFGLECDEWRRTQIGFIHTIGTLLVLPITGFVSDRWGRRVALALNAFNTAWVGVVRSFVNSYEWFLILKTLESTIGAGTYSSCYILVIELVGPKYRALAGATMASVFALGQVILGFIAWCVPDWRMLTRLLYAPQLLIIVYFWILFESVRWLQSKGRHTEAAEILKKAAKINKKELSEKTLEALRVSSTSEQSGGPDISEKEPLLIFQIFKSRVILSRCFVTPIWWITNSLIYYGMNINSVGLAGNQYLNYIYVAAIEIPGYWSAILLLDRIGRKPTLIGGYFLCATCQFGFAFTPAGNKTVSMVLYLLGKYFISMTSVYAYTAELYPTKYRHTLLAFSSTVGRLGSIFAPLTPALMMYWTGIPSVIFGSFAFLSGVLIFTTPETLRTKLPDTIEDAENIGKERVRCELRGLIPSFNSRPNASDK